MSNEINDEKFIPPHNQFRIPSSSFTSLKFERINSEYSRSELHRSKSATMRLIVCHFAIMLFCGSTFELYVILHMPPILHNVVGGGGCDKDRHKCIVRILREKKVSANSCRNRGGDPPQTITSDISCSVLLQTEGHKRNPNANRVSRLNELWFESRQS